CCDHPAGPRRVPGALTRWVGCHEHRGLLGLLLAPADNQIGATMFRRAPVRWIGRASERRYGQSFARSIPHPRARRLELKRSGSVQAVSEGARSIWDEYRLLG